MLLSMRWVNRKRLFLVAMIAAIFGWLAPYLIFVGPSLPRSPEITTQSGFLKEVRSDGIFSDKVHLIWQGGLPTPEALVQIRGRCDDLAPADAFANWGGRGAWITVEQFGWPFRAAHMCVRSISGNILRSSTSTVWSVSGIDFPVGAAWAGVVGNVSVSIGFFSCVYCAVVTALARRRVRRGECVRCGFVLNGAAVCPDCRAAEKRVRRSPRLRKSVKWGSLAATLVILIVWIGSCWFRVTGAGPNRAVVGMVTAGVVHVQYFEPPVRNGSLGIKFETFSHVSSPMLRFSAEQTKDAWGAMTGFFFITPLWAPFLVAAICAWVTWRLDTRISRRASIACMNCDYDTSTLVNETVCPECGAGIPPRTARESGGSLRESS